LLLIPSRKKTRAISGKSTTCVDFSRLVPAAGAKLGARPEEPEPKLIRTPHWRSGIKRHKAARPIRVDLSSFAVKFPLSDAGNQPLTETPLALCRGSRLSLLIQFSKNKK
jgi:hypothetical protein